MNDPRACQERSSLSSNKNKLQSETITTKNSQLEQKSNKKEEQKPIPPDSGASHLPESQQQFLKRLRRQIKFCITKEISKKLSANPDENRRIVIRIANYNKRTHQ